jgi:colanic acid biosynthesis glycosyl transferase WcaI
VRLLVLSQYFWPENFRINDVVEGLVQRGHHVTVYTGMPNYPGGRFFSGYGFFGRSKENHKGAEVRRVPLIPRGGGGGARLALNYLSHAFFATVLAPFRLREDFDAILVYEPSPITIGIPARFLRWLKGAPLVFWVQDLWPESLAATGAVKNPFLLSGVDRLVKWIYRGCDRVLVQSEAFRPSIKAHGVASTKIAYLPNSAEAFYRRIEAGADDIEAREMPQGFRVLYAGNIGAAQDFPTILAAAEKLKGEPRIQWIVLGDGRMREWVSDEIRRRGLQGSFHLLGSRPPERMPRYFAHADALLATLRREPIFAYTIPSKIQTYIACGKPVIAALDGEGGRIIREARAGWAVPSENPEALAEAVMAASRTSAADRNAMGERAEACFRSQFEREKLLGQLESELMKATR